MDKSPNISHNHTSWVYFVQSGDFVKIGFTAQSVNNRMKGLQNASPMPIKLLAFYRGSPALEAQLHRKFKRHNTNGEWFRLVKPIRDYIAKNPTVPHSFSDMDWYDYAKYKGCSEVIKNPSWYNYEIHQTEGLRILDPMAVGNPDRHPELHRISLTDFKRVLEAWERINDVAKEAVEV